MLVDKKTRSKKGKSSIKGIKAERVKKFQWTERELGAKRRDVHQLKDVLILMAEIYNSDACDKFSDRSFTTVTRIEGVIGGPPGNSFHPPSWSSFFAFLFQIRV